MLFKIKNRNSTKEEINETDTLIESEINNSKVNEADYEKALSLIGI